MQTKSLVGCSAVRLSVYPNWTDDNEEEEITSETRLKYEKSMKYIFCDISSSLFLQLSEQ